MRLVWAEESEMLLAFKKNVPAAVLMSVEVIVMMMITSTAMMMITSTAMMVMVARRNTVLTCCHESRGAVRCCCRPVTRPSTHCKTTAADQQEV